MNRRKRCLKLGAVCLLLLILAAGVMGCGRKKKPLAEGEAAYQIYYLNSSASALIPSEYRTQTTNPQMLAGELMEQFLQVPAELDVQRALAEQVEYKGSRQEDVVLYLYFDNNYASMKAYREILCRAALTKTLTQIPGIQYIYIYCGEQPLLDSNGMPVGMLAQGDFIDGITDVNAYEETELTLYFTDKNGELLYPETREVIYYINTSLERVVLDELIRGPESPALEPVLPSGIRLLNVSVTENICYLNFDAGFLNNKLEIRDYIPIYAIVNSLSNLPSVNRVQISVNGSQDVSFRDTIALNTMFERNLDYIGGEDY